ncbi:LytR/AlgR family response regulator transcription factor [Flavobacterium sp.]
MNIKCIIVEDEPLAADVLKDFINEVPFLELIGICPDAFAAMQMLKDHKVELIFLDIHLPKLKGLDFLGTLKNPPQVIITTAYHDFAVKSYEYSVLDYLVKPIEFSRFMIAVNKVIEQRNYKELPSVSANELYFTVNKKKARIPLDSILYIESQKENVKIVTSEKTLLTRYLMSSLENELPADKFIRIHRSFIVAKAKIDFIDANDVEINGIEIPIGRNYKDFVHKSLGL